MSAKSSAVMVAVVSVAVAAFMSMYIDPTSRPVKNLFCRSRRI